MKLCEEYVERRTENGKIRGVIKEVLEGKFVEVFLGVPYARPPVGELRFEYTEKPEPWKGTLNMTSLPAACPQHLGDMDYLQIHFPGFSRTSEDCLYLNIYVPRTDSGKRRLSTFLWIHGGSNESGMGAMLTGEVLAAYGEVIVVNFNYRLGNFGFLHMETGSLGLMDQIEAIKWVNRNVHFFGGDSSKVTLAGHSAGAADVGIHLLNPTLEGLFRHAILMSGSPLSYWAFMNKHVEPEYRRKIRKYLKKVGCEHEDVASSKRCLKSKTESELNTSLRRTVPTMLLHPMPVDNVTIFGPPIKLLTEGKFLTVPVMFGFTKDEGAMIAEYNPLYPWKQYDYTALKNDIKRYRRVKKFSSRFEEIVAHEYMDYSIEEENERCFQGFIQIESDMSIKVPTLHFAKLMQEAMFRRNESSRVSLYSFDYHNEATFRSVSFNLFGKPSVPHGQDLFYVFGIPLIGHSKFNFTSADISLSKHMINIWAKFVKNGSPSNTTSGNEEVFPPFDSESRNFIRISNDNSGYKVETSGPFNMRAYDFWTKVEWLFPDWKNENCINSGSHKLGLTLMTLSFIFIFLF